MSWQIPSVQTGSINHAAFCQFFVLQVRRCDEFQHLVGWPTLYSLNKSTCVPRSFAFFAKARVPAASNHSREHVALSHPVLRSGPALPKPARARTLAPTF